MGLNGIINVYKLAGMTSHDVIYKVRRITGIKKSDIQVRLTPDAQGRVACVHRHGHKAFRYALPFPINATLP